VPSGDGIGHWAREFAAVNDATVWNVEERWVVARISYRKPGIAGQDSVNGGPLRVSAKEGISQIHAVCVRY
jgi:hypothetical protein